MDSSVLSAPMLEKGISHKAQLTVKKEPEIIERKEKHVENCDVSVRTDYKISQKEVQQNSNNYLKQESNCVLAKDDQEDPLAVHSGEIEGKLFNNHTKEELDIRKNDEVKYHPHEDTKYKIDIKEHENGYIVDNNDISYSSKSGNIFEPSNISDNTKGRASGKTNVYTSVFQEKGDGKSINHNFYKDVHTYTNSTNVIEKYKCDMCTKTFLNKKNLRFHFYAVHKKSKNQECNECHKMFSEARSLRIHVDSVHKKIRNYQCPQCEKMFYGQANYQLHINVVHKGIKNFECNNCQKKFPKKHDLLSHINSVHLLIKSFECPECHKMFSRSGHVKDHVNFVHKRIKKYECEVCQKMFSQAGGLKKHVNDSHERIIQYGCHECEKIFYRMGNLRQHINIVHRRIKNVECTVCDKKFSHKGDLRKHVKSMHMLSLGKCV